MHIDAYAFGEMVVDGEAYTSDLVLLPGAVHADWWRENGHRLAVADLGDVLGARPEVLVIGTGAYGVMRVPAETRRALQEAGVEPIIARTGDAAERFNALADAGRRVAGAFHLTC